MCMKRNLAITILIIVVLATLSIAYTSVEGYKINSTTIYVYEDGTVSVQQIIYVDNPPENISIHLLGSPLLIEAESNSTPIHVDISDNLASLISPDKEITLDYVTSSLTNKSGEEWILYYSSSYKTLVILPENSMPYDISPSNFNISIINNSVALVMPPGEVKIQYVITPKLTEKPSSNPFQSITGSYYLLLLFSILIIIIIVVIYLLYRKKTKNKPAEYNSLDTRDDKILTVLSKYGELTAREIMEKTNIPKTPLYRRLRKLINLGLIETKTIQGVQKYRISKKSIK